MDTEDDLVRQLQDKLNESDSAQNESDRNSQIGKRGLEERNWCACVSGIERPALERRFHVCICSLGPTSDSFSCLISLLSLSHFSFVSVTNLAGLSRWTRDGFQI